MKKIVRVAVGVIQNSNGEIFIAKRADDAHQGGLWEFPGGKIESGETTFDALHRELFEELDIQISSARPLILIQHGYSDKSVLLDVWLVKEFSGTPFGKEGQPTQWVPRDKLKDFSFPAANVPILSAIRLPEKLLITPEFEIQQTNAFLEKLRKAVRSYDIQHVIFRAKQLSDEEYVQLVPQILDITSSNGGKLILNCAESIWRVFSENAGWHLTANRLAALDTLPISNQPISASCHSSVELKKAEDLGCEFALLSPVVATNSHPDADSLGWEKFSTLVKLAKLPVYALGGMTLADIEQAHQFGAQGIAAISAFLE